MLGQLKIGFDGEIRDKIEASINRLQAMCPEEGYYVARTILDLEDGYQDARVIAKPDESWLNPGEIK